MKHRFDRKADQAQGLHARRKESLSDVRYQDLLTKAGAFFAQAEKDADGRRQAVISEIRQTMAQYELTVHDLR